MEISSVPTFTYKPKNFDQSTYVVESYQYPSDLMGRIDEDGMNYVIFYINVNNESKMIKNAEDLTVKVDLSERVKKGILAQDYSKAVQDTIKDAAADAAKLTGISNIKDIGAKIGNAIGSTFSRPQKRLKTAIALHVPNQLSIKYGAGWQDEDTFGLQAILEGGSAVGRALKKGSKSLPNDAAASNSIGRLSSIAASYALSNIPGGAGISAMTGLAPNPMKEQIFKGVDFRTFTMEYQFAPRSQVEAKNVLNIIQTFKYHMHPEYKGENNFLFLYPSEFDISYFHAGKENLNIHRHTSCVLTDLDINYTPNGNFSTFAGGMPTQINVSMSFKELTILTKELIAQGL